jgi:hypothetical protein
MACDYISQLQGNLAKRQAFYFRVHTHVNELVLDIYILHFIRMITTEREAF